LRLARSLLLLLVAASACRAAQTGGLKEVEGGIEIGLRRGAGWNTYTVRPPHIVGPMGTLQLKKGRLTGSIGGRQTSIQITDDGLSGQAGGKSVEVDIFGGPDDIEVDGLWAGSRVHFTITPTSLRGTIGGDLQGSEESPGRIVNREASDLLRCQYTLDHTESDGSRTGWSICTSLAEETRIEFPRPIQAWLTRNEAVAVLLALLSSPPRTNLERR
jgi:hypothetical protein